MLGRRTVHIQPRKIFPNDLRHRIEPFCPCLSYFIHLARSGRKVSNIVFSPPSRYWARRNGPNKKALLRELPAAYDRGRTHWPLYTEKMH